MFKNLIKAYDVSDAYYVVATEPQFSNPDDRRKEELIPYSIGIIVVSCLLASYLFRMLQFSCISNLRWRTQSSERSTNSLTVQ